MNRACVKSYLEMIHHFEDRDFLLNYIRYNIAATLKGIKPSYLMIFSKKKNRDLYKNWKDNRRYISDNLNIEFIELKYDERSIHVLFYKKNKLEKILKDKTNRKFLLNFGYNNLDSIKETILHLRNRYEISCSHEIGVFLGYPVHDVVHFIYPTEKECILSGYWKVFGDREAAEKTFKEYDKCRIEVLNNMYEKTYK